LGGAEETRDFGNREIWRKVTKGVCLENPPGWKGNQIVSQEREIGALGWGGVGFLEGGLKSVQDCRKSPKGSNLSGRD